MKNYTFTNTKQRLWIPLMLLLLGYLPAAYAQSDGWFVAATYTIDEDGDVGKHNSISLAPDGKVGIAYFDDTQDVLKYAKIYANGTVNISTLDTENSTGLFCNLAIDEQNRKNILYFDNTKNTVEYAGWLRSWEITIMDEDGDVGMHNSLCMDGFGRPHISYYDATNDRLKTKEQNYSGAWLETIVDDINNTGLFTTFSVDEYGRKNILYFDATKNTVEYAGWLRSWEKTIMDEDGDVGMHNSLCMDGFGRPHISYYDATNDRLKTKEQDYSGAWLETIVDDINNTGLHTTFSVDEYGRKNILYFDATKNTVEYAGWLRTWETETLADYTGNAKVGEYNSLDVVPSGHVFLTYTDDFLKELRCSVFDGSEWATTVIDHDDEPNYNFYPKYSDVDVGISPDGTYDAKVLYMRDGSQDSVWMANRSIQINTPPIITKQPDGGTILRGEDFEFSVSVMGTPTLHYQWQHNYVDIPYANEATYQIENAVVSDWGGYRCKISNGLGNATSEMAVLLVYKPGYLTGVVSDEENGDPIAGARVEVLPKSTDTYALTDENGEWTIAVYPGEDYTVEIRLADYFAIIEEHINVAKNETVSFVHQMTAIVMAYDNIRIAPFALAPNANPVQVVNGGYGYAWFMVEGLIDGNWLPLPSVTIQTESVSGKLITSVSQFINFEYLQTPIFRDFPGLFSVKIHHLLIGDGTTGETETFTVKKVGGVELNPANQASFTARVDMNTYEYSIGYNYYGQVGLMATSGFVMAKGYVGKGTGSELKLSYSGIHGSSPVLQKFSIQRSIDRYAGFDINASTNPAENLLSFSLSSKSSDGYGASIGGGMGIAFPYNWEYEFDYANLTGGEAALALYYYYEPYILYAKHLGQTHTTFGMAEFACVMINNLVDGINDIDVLGPNAFSAYRVSDEVSCELNAHLSAEAQLGFNVENVVKAELKANVGLNGSGYYRIKTSIDPDNGQLNEKASIGINMGSTAALNVGLGLENVLPANLGIDKGLKTGLSMGCEIGIVSKYNADNYLYFKNDISGYAPSFNAYNIPTGLFSMSSWFNVDKTDAINLLFNTVSLPDDVLNLGVESLAISYGSDSFKSAMADVAGLVYENQQTANPVIVDYGTDVSTKKENNMDFEINIPILSPFGIHLGVGRSSFQSLDYVASRGKWVNGMPCLQSEQSTYPSPIEASNPLDNLFGIMTGSSDWSIIKDHLISSFKIKNLLPFDDDSTKTKTVIVLNDNGSKINLSANSIPSYISEANSIYWEWYQETPKRMALPAEDREKLKKHHNAVKLIRQEATGMKYGIGGFYDFTPSREQFTDEPQLTIIYTNEDVVGIDESSLRLFYEDTTNNWQIVPSTVYPAQNKVVANIKNFATYTLAPILPTGTYGFIQTPDSVPNITGTIVTLTSGILRNNDSTIIENGTQFTVKNLRGVLLNNDANTDIEGVQVETINGKITLDVEVDNSSIPISISAGSTIGYANVVGEINIYDATTPETPEIIFSAGDDKSAFIEWDFSDESDVAGYNLYYDSDQSGAPYDGTATVWGSPSPVNAGMVNHANLNGLINGKTYYITITSYDINGNESPYSNEVIVVPNVPSYFLNASTSTILASPNADTLTFEIQSNVNWYLSSNAAWMKASPVYSFYNKTISVVCDEYLGVESRMAILTIFGENLESQEITVIQGSFPQHNMLLSKGWSGISSFIDPADANVESMFEDIESQLIIVQNDNGMYWPGQNVNTLGNWNMEQGYKIKVAQNVNMTISGNRSQNHNVTMDQSWNLMPVLSECPADVAFIFSGKDVSIVKEVAGWRVYWPEFGINTLVGLQPGKAYFALMGSAEVIEFPECETPPNSPLRGRTAQIPNEATGLCGGTPFPWRGRAGDGVWKFSNPTPISHNIALPISANTSSILSVGDIVGVFDGSGDCYGLAEWKGANTALTTFGNDPMTVDKDGFDDGETMVFKLFRMEDESEITLEVAFNYSMPQTDAFAENGLSAINNLKAGNTGFENFGRVQQSQIVPNPAHDAFTLILDSDPKSEGTLELYNLKGQLMKQVEINAKSTKVEINDLPAGVYVANISIDNQTMIKQLIKH